MNIDTHLIDRYLQDEPVYADADAWIFRNTDPIDPRRHDVVHELCRQVCGLRWPCFNPALHARLFPHLDTVLEEMSIILTAAASDVPTYLCEQDDQQHLVIDLIQVANLTRIVPAMMHIICNFISLTCAQRCIASDFPGSPASYAQQLDLCCFREGLANWLAWGSDAQDYQFQDGLLKSAMRLLNEAYGESDPALQRLILTRVPALPFWKQFPLVAGMLTFHDVYQRGGIEAVHALYRSGWQAFCPRIIQKKTSAEAD